MGSKSIEKLFLTFCKSHRGFTRQPVSPNVHSWHLRFKHNQNSTRRPPERERKKERKWRRKKQKKKKFWAVRRREVPRKGPEGWCPEGWCNEGWSTQGWGAQGWGPEGWGPKFRAFFLSPATIFILSSSLGGRFVEFWWCDWRPGPTIEICGMSTNNWEKSLTKRSTSFQILYCVLVRYTRTPNQMLHGNKDWDGSKHLRNTENWTELMVSQWEFEWNIFPGFTTLQLCHKVQELLYFLIFLMFWSGRGEERDFSHFFWFCDFFYFFNFLSNSSPWMSTDVCSAEDLNILHITECLSLSFVASLEEWLPLPLLNIHPVHE